MDRLYLIATIAGERVAMSTADVDSVVKVRDSVPVPSASPFIAGLFALRSRVLTLIDCQFFVTGEPADIEPGQEAVVVRIGGFSYGLLVDDVQDVVSTENVEKPLHGKLPAGWHAIGTAMLDIAGETYLVVSPAQLVNPTAKKAA